MQGYQDLPYSCIRSVIPYYPSYHLQGHTCYKHPIDSLIWGPPKLDTITKTCGLIKGISYRVIPRLPERILDAPGVLNDQLTSPISWCQSKSILAVALKNSIYLWEEKTSSIISSSSFLWQITAVLYISPILLAIGFMEGSILLWDPISKRQSFLRRINKLSHSITCISVGPCGTIIAGDAKGSFYLFSPNGSSSVKMNAHLCPIAAISFEHQGIFASSDSVGNVSIWKIHESATPTIAIHATLIKYKGSHPIKALSWCPWRPSLLVIAGSASISLWNTFTGAMIAESLLEEGSTHASSLHWWWNSNDLAPLLVLLHFNYEISLWSLPNLLCINRIQPELESSVIHSNWTGSKIVAITAEEKILFHSLEHVVEQAPSLLNSPPYLYTSKFFSPNRRPIPITSPLQIKSLSSPKKCSNFTVCQTEFFSPESQRLLFS